MQGARPTAQAPIPITARPPRWRTNQAVTGKNSCRRPARIVDVVQLFPWT
jgi:hypothetical protein